MDMFYSVLVPPRELCSTRLKKGPDLRPRIETLLSEDHN